jgi:hypothetical protein
MLDPDPYKMNTGTVRIRNPAQITKNRATITDRTYFLAVKGHTLPQNNTVPRSVKIWCQAPFYENIGIQFCLKVCDKDLNSARLEGKVRQHFDRPPPPTGAYYSHGS